MFLSATTHTLELTTNAAVTVDVMASWADYASGTVSLGSTPTAITTATTTTILAAPGASTTRKLKYLTARNKHATLSVDVTIQLDVSSTHYEIYKTTLAAGQTLQYDENVGFFVLEPLALYAKSRQVLAAGTAATYTTPAGIRAILIEAVGAGGGSGGVANAATNSGAAGGGGSGAYSSTLVQNPSATYTYTIGAGGTAGASGANNGGVGGDTTFGAVCTAKGGLGGIADTIATIHVGGAGGAGGPSSSGVGDQKQDGNPGGAGMALAAAQAISGEGGNSVFAGGAPSVRNSTAGGTTGIAGGGGASGACAISGGASQAGAVGGAGLIVVSEFA